MWVYFVKYICIDVWKYWFSYDSSTPFWVNGEFTRFVEILMGHFCT